MYSLSNSAGERESIIRMETDEREVMNDEKSNAYIRGMFSRSRVSVPKCLPNFLLQVQDFGEHS